MKDNLSKKILFCFFLISPSLLFCQDTTPPGKISTLQGKPGNNETEINLQWKSPGDNGYTGWFTNTQDAFYIQYSQYLILWSTQYAQIIIPTPTEGYFPGDTVQYTVTGLQASATYYLVIWARDKAGNFSELSNTVTTYAQNFWPSAVNDFTAHSNETQSEPNYQAETEIDLTWTAPGDDGTVGAPQSYELRYATFSLIEENFSQGNLISLPFAASTYSYGTPLRTTITGLFPSTVYYFKLKVTDDAGLYIFSNSTSAPASDYPPQNPPQNFNIQASTYVAKAIHISWTKNPEIDIYGYKVYRSTISGAITTKTLITTILHPKTTHLDTGLVIDTTYYYQVSAIDLQGKESAGSPQKQTYPLDIVAPSPIYLLTGFPHPSIEGALQLQWVETGDDEYEGKAFRHIIKISSEPIARRIDEPADDFQTWRDASEITKYSPYPSEVLPSGTTQTLTITGLIPTATYYFRMKVMDNVGNLSKIDIVEPKPRIPAAGFAPFAVTTLQAKSGAQETEVDLKWNAPGDDEMSGNASYYEIFYATFPINTTTIESQSVKKYGSGVYTVSAGKQVSVTLNNLNRGITFYFVIKSFDDANIWSLSNSPSAIPTDLPPAQPQGLKVENTGEGGILKISWNANTEVDMGYYYLYRSTFSSDWDKKQFIIRLSHTERPLYIYTDRDLYNGTPYYYRLVAVDMGRGLPGKDDGSDVLSSSQSVEAYAIPTLDIVPPAPITFLSVQTGVEEGEVFLSFTAPADDEDYESSGKVQGYLVSASTLSKRDFGDNIYLWSQTAQKFYFSTSTIIGGVEIPAENFRVYRPTNPTVREFLSLTGLIQLATYYFGIQSFDDAIPWPNYSDYDSTPKQPWAWAQKDLQPPGETTISTYSHTRYTITLSWVAPGDDYWKRGKATKYDLRTSTSPIYSIREFDEAIVITGLPQPSLMGTTQYFTISGLTPFITYYFALVSFDEIDNKSGMSNVVFDAPSPPEVIPPKPPTNIVGVLSEDKDTFTIYWDGVVENIDGTPADDLAGYIIYRSVQPYGPYEKINQQINALTLFSDKGVKNKIYYYKISAIDFNDNESEKSVRIDNLGTIAIKVEPPAEEEIEVSVELLIPNETSKFLSIGNNPYADNLIPKLYRRTNDEKNETIRSFEFAILKSKTLEKIPDFKLPWPGAIIRVYYNIKNGYIFAPNFTNIPSKDAKNRLGIFYYNNVEFIKIPSKVDETARFVQSQTLLTGIYQLRVTENSPQLKITSVENRIFTPQTGVYFKITVDKPETEDLTGEIYDLTGTKIKSSLDISSFGVGSLQWDGKDDSGIFVNSGPYIYQIKSGGKILRGICIVAH